MKKFLLWCIGITFPIISFAQITWNAKIGMNISNWTGYEGADVKAGFKIGGGMEYKLNEFWAVQPSLYLTTKGAKGKVIEGNNGTVNQMYIEFPVKMAVRFNVANKTFIVLSAGPYIASGVGGKMKSKVLLKGEMGDRETFGNSTLNRFDGGIEVGIAAEIDKFIIGIDGQWGLAKLIDKTNLVINPKMKDPRNISASLMVGYNF